MISVRPVAPIQPALRSLRKTMSLEIPETYCGVAAYHYNFDMRYAMITFALIYVFYIIQMKEGTVKAEDKKGRIPLHIAAGNDKSSANTGKLVGYQALVNPEDKKGRIPLHIAAGNDKSSANTGKLVGYQALVNPEDKKGRIPLHIAAGNDKSSANTGKYISSGADVN
ncbi:ankyrin repeat and protein kinase domain-containing protein 1 [Ditylenchus destructor]|uniref:Ankyrin repeat and protein kinase domain-containing protein 1 n=1 Tax=Ditylenchus destructor TaxID=166010 RepID=A0AAD4MMT1_9BILA|nr:ankyrin repeat and protein kinase domain-containing protein 1 [Ditylenchus destructor]